jgi:hypothetical protein
MKKTLIALLVVAVVAGSVMAVLQIVKPSEIGNASTKVKELEKEGWKVMGTSLSLEAAMAIHNQLLETREEIIAKAMSTQMNIGTAKIQQDALIRYAEQQADTITLETNEEDIAKITEMVVKGNLEQSFILYREVTSESGKKYYEFQGYYTITPSEP